MSADRDTMLADLRSAGIREVRIAYVDYNGLSRARSVALEHLPRVLERGINFSSSGVSFNSRDLFPATASFDLASTDIWAVPDPLTCRPAPDSPQVGEMFAHLIDAQGAPWPGCPRTALSTAIERARTAGLDFDVGFEPEGYLFRPVDGDIAFVGSPKFATLDGLALAPGFMRDLLTYLSSVGIEVEQWTEEYGPGQIEVNLRYQHPLAAADELVRYRQAFRSLARQHDLVGTFMPKPFEDVAGSGLHVHLSATGVDDTGRNLFEGNADPALGLSVLGRGALAGLIHHGAALTALGASTVNSYKRFRPGSWAPTHIMYAYASRAAFIRIPERETARRLELRVGDPAGNPYLFLTAILAAALDGVANGLEPGPPLPGDIGQSGENAGATPVPRNLAQALDALERDAVIRSALGSLIVDEYLKIKRSEWDAFVDHVGPWDREWYLGRY